MNLFPFSVCSGEPIQKYLICFYHPLKVGTAKIDQLNFIIKIMSRFLKISIIRFTLFLPVIFHDLFFEKPVISRKLPGKNGSTEAHSFISYIMARNFKRSSVSFPNYLIRAFKKNKFSNQLFLKTQNLFTKIYF
jgi:hypothetical protein